MSNPMMEAHQGIENIRRALVRSEQGLSQPRPAILAPRNWPTIDSQCESFLEEVRNVSGVTQKITPQTVSAALKTLVFDNNIHKAAVWQTAWFKELGIENTLRELEVELVAPTADKRDLALCDLGVTSAEYLLPETGTLVLRSSAEMPRPVSLLPPIHLAIVRPEMLRDDLQQVFAETKNNHYSVFITGPSRTGDIELVHTLGVHGPKNLYVWMMYPSNHVF
jgi:L-lactate dehydrogenase complex protein LldG